MGLAPPPPTNAGACLRVSACLCVWLCVHLCEGRILYTCGCEQIAERACQERVLLTVHQVTGGDGGQCGGGQCPGVGWESAASEHWQWV